MTNTKKSNPGVKQKRQLLETAKMPIIRPRLKKNMKEKQITLTRTVGMLKNKKSIKDQNLNFWNQLLKLIPRFLKRNLKEMGFR